MIDDAEINKRVAEIEGWVLCEWIGHPERPTHWAHNNHNEIYSSIPYATDWAWCGPLIEKYAISLLTDAKTEWRAVSVREPFTEKTRDRWGEYETTPQRAICLAVIAARG